MSADAVFTVGSLLFIAALLPAVWSESKPPRATCALTAGVLAAFAVTYLTLGLTFSAVTTGMTCCLWTVLLLQRRTA